MRASFFRKYGGPEVLEYGDWPDPSPAPGEVLVDVHAASVNAADWKMRAGQYGAQIKLHAGETILIQGGAVGVAGFAIALAKHLGARVITTASAANHAYVRSPW